MTKLGYQIPNFTYPGVAPADQFGAIKRQAVEADTSGFDTVMVMDHFYQLPMLGPPELDMIECYTLLSALAQHTSTVRLSALVTGNTYRSPALLAKTVTALDVVSGGRAQLGIGAGWFQEEHDSLGFEFGTFTERFEKLEEALQIIIGMFNGEKPTLDGTWYRVNEALNVPAPLGKIPIMIGGSGEKKTIPLAVKHFDHLNVIAGFDELRRKLDVVKARCEEIGRDPATLETSMLVIAIIDENVTEDLIPEDFRQQAVFGSAERVAEQIKTKVLDAGITGVILSPVTSLNGYQPGGVTAVAEALKPHLTG